MFRAFFGIDFRRRSDPTSGLRERACTDRRERDRKIPYQKKVSAADLHSADCCRPRATNGNLCLQFFSILISLISRSQRRASNLSSCPRRSSPSRSPRRAPCRAGRWEIGRRPIRARRRCDARSQEAFALAGCGPLEHLLIAVGVAEREIGWRPMNFSMPTGLPGPSSMKSISARHQHGLAVAQFVLDLDREPTTCSGGMP